MKGVAKAPLDLKQFMQRAEVLRMYRNIFRTARKISSDSDRQQVIDWARKEFRDNKNLDDMESIRSQLKYATTLLNELQQSLELSQSRS